MKSLTGPLRKLGDNKLADPPRRLGDNCSIMLNISRSEPNGDVIVFFIDLSFSIKIASYEGIFGAEFLTNFSYLSLDLIFFRSFFNFSISNCRVFSIYLISSHLS